MSSTANLAQDTDIISLYGQEFADDPHAVYERLRHRYGPLAPALYAPGIKVTLVLGYREALQIARHPDVGKTPHSWQETLPEGVEVPPLMQPRPNTLYSDGVEHRRLRSAGVASLMAVSTHDVAQAVTQTAADLLAPLSRRGQADLITEYTDLMPLRVFTRLFGCPPELGNHIADCVRRVFNNDEDAERANNELLQGLTELVGLKRHHPDADVTSRLLARSTSEQELLQQLVLFLGTGADPVGNLIANTIHLLLADERFAGALTNGGMAPDAALDEALWRVTPVANYGIVYPRHDLTIAHRTLPADQPIVISYAACNVDPAVTDHNTADVSENRAHLSWGAGPHRCPADRLAMQIAMTGITSLLDYLPGMELAIPASSLTWRPGAFHRALASLPVTFPITSQTPTPPVV